MSEPINAFVGPHRFLSNFWPVRIVHEGITYGTTEHAYQAAKTGSTEHKLAIAKAPSPGIAKTMGKRAPIHPNWDEIKVDVMATLLRLKFSEVGLRRRLLYTGDAELIEGNTWGDTFWGVCKGQGENMLGKLLMAERERIRSLQH